MRPPSQPPLRRRLADADDQSGTGEYGGTSSVTPLGYREGEGTHLWTGDRVELVRRLRLILPEWTVEDSRPDGRIMVTIALHVGADWHATSASFWKRYGAGLGTMMRVLALLETPFGAPNVMRFFRILSQWANEKT